MSINEYFIGREITPLNGDKFAIQFIEPDALKEDVGYQDTKWWDYRTFHPTALTCYFAQMFYRLCGEVAASEIGTFEANRYKTKAKSFDLRKQSLAVIRGFWKARMNADAMGVPYDIYIKGALNNFRANFHLMKSTKGTNQQFPYPQQLVNDFINTAVLQEWALYREVFFPYPTNEDILHKEVWFRKDMEKWLAKELRSTDLPKRRFRECVERGAIILPASPAI